MQCALFYASHADKFTSPKHNLLVFQLRTKQSARSRPTRKSVHNFRRLQHSCSSLPAVLILSIALITFLKYVLLSYFYHSKSHGLRTRRIQLLRKFVCQSWEKRLTHLVHCTESQIVLKTGQEKLYPPTDISVSLTVVSPIPTFGQV